MSAAGVVVIGAGVVGLACAAELASRGRDVLVLERHEGPARETSSRNSGVVHAGLYYPTGSLKAQSCVEGRELVYERCARDKIQYRKVGKLIVATQDDERRGLHELYDRGLANGAGALRLIDEAELERLEPRLRARAALWSPETGIVDPHGLCDSYRRQALANGASFAWRTALVGLEPRGGGWRVRTADASVDCELLVNAAGLESDRVAALAGLDIDALGWRIHPCKGDYFTIASRLGAITTRLVYPLPQGAGLGVHVTMDLGGAYRAGPDVEHVPAPRYDVDPQKSLRFADALRRFLPEIEAADLSPGYAGVRPKLAEPGGPFRDFVLEERPAGLVHLIGIESPGLTAAESLARRVARMARG